MLVKDYMTRHPILIEPSLRVAEAQRIMVENRIRHLPVVGSGKRLLGLVTRQRLAIYPDRLASLDVWEITRYLSDLTVGKVMVSGADLRTVWPDATLEDAADIMIRGKVGGLPVCEDDVVVGIITDTDLLLELRNLLGAIEPGFRVTMRVPDRKGEFRRLLRAISERGWGIMAMGSVRSPKHPDKWDLVIKVRHCNRDELAAALQEVTDQEIVDLREASTPNH
jgi:acetoin utilization protein AcuB